MQNYVWHRIINRKKAMKILEGQFWVFLNSMLKLNSTYFNLPDPPDCWTFCRLWSIHLCIWGSVVLCLIFATAAAVGRREKFWCPTNRLGVSMNICNYFATVCGSVTHTLNCSMRSNRILCLTLLTLLLCNCTWEVSEEPGRTNTKE